MVTYLLRPQSNWQKVRVLKTTKTAYRRSTHEMSLGASAPGEKDSSAWNRTVWVLFVLAEHCEGSLLSVRVKNVLPFVLQLKTVS